MAGTLNEKLDDMFHRMLPSITPEWCIFRVPKRLRMIKESAYTPRVISIGPFHHKKDELQFMENQKVRNLSHYKEEYGYNLYDLLTNITEWEESIRQSYGERIELSSEDLVMMVLLDGLFVIEYFRRNCFPRLKDKNHKILYGFKLRHSIFFDLVLLENQLPFFVLESLYDLVFPNEQLSFLEISCQFFSYFNKQYIILAPLEKVLHFTDLMRTFYLPRQRLEATDSESNNVPDPCSAKELEENGVIFKASSSKCFLDIRFTVRNGVYEIPKLVIYDETESVLRNMMALEQYMYINQSYICDYVYLMDTLIDTSKDVKLLVGKGIITNNIGDHEKVATLFNNLNNEIVLGDLGNSCFRRIRQDSSNYHQKFLPKWWESFKKNYCSTPWQIASVAAAFVLLGLTLVQAICSIMQVVQGSKPK